MCSLESSCSCACLAWACVLHLSTIVMSSHMHGKALSDEGNIDLKVVTLIDNRIIVLQMRPKMHVLFVPT